MEAADFYDLLLNRLFADPLLLGRSPGRHRAVMPGDVEADLKAIAEPIDWYGINYYQPTEVGAPEGAEIEFSGLTLPAQLPFSVRGMEGYPVTDFGWPVVPEALTELLVGFRERYGLPPAGRHHRERLQLRGHRRPGADRRSTAMSGRCTGRWSRAWMFAGISCGRCWTIQLAEGYARRFGLVHVDYDTLKRTPKASYTWLRDALRARG